MKLPLFVALFLIGAGCAGKPVVMSTEPANEPITRAEKSAFIKRLGQCWDADALIGDASKTTVIVGFSMTPDAIPETGSIKLISAQGGSDSAAEEAYIAARQAMLRCGRAGFKLPADKYNQWRSVEVKFNAMTKGIG